MFRGYYIRMKALEYAFNMFYTVYDQKEVQVKNNSTRIFREKNHF
jgi:hypothetical protein